MTEIILYDAVNTPSPRRTRICLIEKQLPFTVKWLNLGLMDHKQPWYIELNPTGVVPTAIIDGRTIFDSSVINEYIDAIHPDPSLVPRDAWGQAQMRMWFGFENDLGKPFREVVHEIMGKERLKKSGMSVEELRQVLSKRAINEAYIRYATKLLLTERDDDLIQDRMQIIFEKMALMEQMLSDGRPWSCGDRFTLADIALAPRLEMFPLIGVNDLYEQFPSIGALIARIKARPSWESSMIRPEPGESERFVDPRHSAEH